VLASANAERVRKSRTAAPGALRAWLRAASLRNHDVGADGSHDDTAPPVSFAAAHM
jgi:hypothetical protein